MSNLFTGLLNMGTGFAGAVGEAKKNKYDTLLAQMVKDKKADEDKKNADAAAGSDGSTSSGGDGQEPKTPTKPFDGGAVECSLRRRMPFSLGNGIFGPGIDVLPDPRDDFSTWLDFIKWRGSHNTNPNFRPRQDPFQNPIAYYQLDTPK
jgi:hypothetical protein